MSILDHAKQMPNDDYHSRVHISSTKYETIRNESLLAYHHKYVANPDNTSTPAQTLGSLAHTLTFEPEKFEDEYMIAPSFNLSTKEGKDELWDLLVSLDAVDQMEHSEYLKMKADDKRALLHSSGKTMIDADALDRAESIARIAWPYLPRLTRKVEAVYEAEIEGVPCQCKCDLITESGEIWDFKTTGMIQSWMSGFIRGNMVYKDAFYRMVIQAATGTLPPPVRYIVVESVEPYDCIIRYHNPDVYRYAVERIKEDLRRVKEAEDSGVWLGIDEKIEPRGEMLSEWVLQDLEVQDVPEMSLDDVFGPDPE
jgi:hypothetical protein